MFDGLALNSGIAQDVKGGAQRNGGADLRAEATEERQDSERAIGAQLKGAPAAAHHVEIDAADPCDGERLDAPFDAFAVGQQVRREVIRLDAAAGGMEKKQFLSEWISFHEARGSTMHG